MLPRCYALVFERDIADEYRRYESANDSNRADDSHCNSREVWRHVNDTCQLPGRNRTMKAKGDTQEEDSSCDVTSRIGQAKRYEAVYDQACK